MRTAVLVPCYKRPEYTKLCIESIEQAQGYKDVTFYLVDDASLDGTAEVLEGSNLNKVVTVHRENKGLRNIIIDFFEEVLRGDFTHITKIDSDCTVPKYWLADLTRIFMDADADVLSPNVSETNAARKYGAVSQRDGAFIPSAIVGGLWFMKREMIENMYFERIHSTGIRAAFHIINQIIVEKEPIIGWTDEVTYGDIGHWGGTHPDHIKSIDHAAYSAEVGRPIAWQPGEMTGGMTGETDVQN